MPKHDSANATIVEDPADAGGLLDHGAGCPGLVGQTVGVSARER